MESIVQSQLEQAFDQYRNHIIGNDARFEGIQTSQHMLYADWIASGRLYQPIEDTLTKTIGPMVANPHSFSSESGKASTYAYKHARQIIKDHVNASSEDVLVTSGTGMTGVLSRLQRVMGLRLTDFAKKRINIPEEERPVVFITHMEHHSNHVPWLETIADVVIVPCGDRQLVDPEQLRHAIQPYLDRPLLIGSFTACSNVTGIITPYHELAKIMHEHGGLCLVDFAASAPYVSIDMHPAEPGAHLDAIFFSPHKFLGGPGSCGVLVFHESLYNTQCPDVPGGGNVKWTDPSGAFAYCTDIETKEDGGTPGFLQVMRAALAIRLKESMNPDRIASREKELLAQCYEELLKIPGLYILGDRDVDRIGCVSFGVKDIHYNLIVRLLNDRYGIQVRGGWSCASTYAHHLFDLSSEQSKAITEGIATSNLTEKPGWVRISLHPITTDQEVRRITDAVAEIVHNIDAWKADYAYNQASNEWETPSNDSALIEKVQGWFEL